HTRFSRDWSSDVCSSDLMRVASPPAGATSLRSRVRTVFAAGVDLLFPPACATCGKGGRRICATCAQLVTPVPDTICIQCGRVQRSEERRVGKEGRGGGLV